MRLIRNGVFETNSSSTHSISIKRYERPKANDIPRNCDEIYIVSDYGDVGGGDETYACDIHDTEVDKLEFLINMIASIYENSDLYMKWDCDKKDDVNYKNEQFTNLINQDLFIWLKEVVYEETGTQIEFEQPSHDWFPFFETTYTEDGDLESLLDAEKDDDGNYNKDKFKARIRDIIFNNKVYIENENCPYGMEI